MNFFPLMNYVPVPHELCSSLSRICSSLSRISEVFVGVNFPRFKMRRVEPFNDLWGDVVLPKLGYHHSFDFQFRFMSELNFFCKIVQIAFALVNWFQIFILRQVQSLPCFLGPFSTRC